VAYVLSKSFILLRNGLFEGAVKSVVVPKERAVDIDDILDFKFAELLYAEAKDAVKR
jgi:N-acylneuraminate cytidylyltransferase